MNSLSTAITGAKIGGQLGGAWGALGGAALGLFVGGNAQKKQDEMQRKFNDQVVKYAAQDLFDLRRQQNVQNMRTAQALASYQDNKRVANASATAAMGAADIIGSSADALKQAMAFQTDAAQADVMINYFTAIENYNTTVASMTNQRSGQFSRQSTAEPIDLGSIISGGVGIYNDYIKGHGDDLLSDARFAWQNRDQYLNLAKNEVKLQANSLMGQLGTVWKDNKAAFDDYRQSRSGAKNLSTINSGVIDTPDMKTFPLGR